jgi:PAS domain-containing protein
MQQAVRHRTVDLTDHRVALQAVREREKPLRMLVDQIPGLVWTTGPDLSFTSSFGEGFASLGVAPNQVVGMQLAELFEGAEPEQRLVPAHLRALAGRETAFRLRWAGRTFHAKVQPLKDGQGETIGAVGVAVESPTRSRPATVRV